MHAIAHSVPAACKNDPPPREMKRAHPRSCGHARIQERSRGWVNNNGEVVSIFNSFCHAYVDMHVVFFPRMYCMVYIAPSLVGESIFNILCQRVGGAGEVGTATRRAGRSLDHFDSVRDRGRALAPSACKGVRAYVRVFREDALPTTTYLSSFYGRNLPPDDEGAPPCTARAVMPCLITHPARALARRVVSACVLGDCASNDDAFIFLLWA